MGKHDSTPCSRAGHRYPADLSPHRGVQDETVRRLELAVQLQRQEQTQRVSQSGTGSR